MTAIAASPTARPNKTALTAVVLLHGAAIAALVLAKGPNVIHDVFGTTDIYNVPVEPPPPPPEPKPHPKVDIPQQPQVVDHVRPVVDIIVPRNVDFDTQPTKPVELTLLTTPREIIEKPVPVQIPPEPKKVEPAHARANLASYVSNDDYPSSAIRAEEQGTTRFRLTVGPDGRVTDCAVTGSSGSAALDATTCRLMKSRARFTPARDSDGKSTTDIVSNAIRWVLPDA